MVRRLMPTVGCEADAIAFTEEQSGCSSSSSGDGVAAAADAGVLLVASADGSYSTGKQQASLPQNAGALQQRYGPLIEPLNTFVWHAWLSTEADPTQLQPISASPHAIQPTDTYSCIFGHLKQLQLTTPLPLPAGPSTWPAADEKRFMQLQLEHCFVLPQQPEQQQQPQFRVKVVQNFRRAWGPAGGWRLTGVDLHREK
jgi:hypothetical protein